MVDFVASLGQRMLRTVVGVAVEGEVVAVGVVVVVRSLGWEFFVVIVVSRLVVVVVGASVGIAALVTVGVAIAAVVVVVVGSHMCIPGAAVVVAPA
jgi:hypothetical protein